MGWLQSIFSPLKKFWLRLHSPPNKRSGGIYILYEDVKSCQYEDVHVLWSILVESHTPKPVLPAAATVAAAKHAKLLCPIPPPKQVNERG
ncbi:unnamed protein product [Amaranthus hypochondriacus]